MNKPREFGITGKWGGDYYKFDAHECVQLGGPDLKEGEKLEVIEYSAFESLRTELEAVKAENEKLDRMLQEVTNLVTADSSKRALDRLTRANAVLKSGLEEAGLFIHEAYCGAKHHWACIKTDQSILEVDKISGAREEAK